MTRTSVWLVSSLLALAALVAPHDAHAQESFSAGSVATEAEAETPGPAPTARLPHRNPWAVRFDGGYAVRNLFDLSVTGTDLGFGLGVQTSHHFAAWWATRLSLGSTDNGLSVWSLRSGAEIEAVLDPVRIGLGLGLMVIDVGRAGRSDDVRAWGMETRLFARLDAWRTDDFALFVRGSLDAGIETSTASVFWGPGLGLGLELGVSGKRRPEWTASAPPIPRL